MGVLRFTLALCVVIDHSGMNLVVPGFVAVKCFFVISGFLISHVYYSYEKPRDFYRSRFLRLFPVYWIAMIFACIYFLFTVAFLNTKENPFVIGISFTKIILQLFQNILIVTTDFNWFYTTFYGDSRSSIDHIWIPPIWSVALEIYFYLLIPVLIKISSKILVSSILILVCLQSLFYIKGYNSEPWHARFFFFEASFFLMGILSYRLMAKHSDFFRTNHYLYLMIFLITLVLMNTEIIIKKFPILYGNDYYLIGILLTILLTVTLPFLFLQIKSKSDTFVGDLSYLVYIWHYAFVTIFKALNFSYNFFYPVLALTLIHAVLTKMLVADRIEKIRHKRYKKVSMLDYS